jgi:hypothetical protein
MEMMQRKVDAQKAAVAAKQADCEAAERRISHAEQRARDAEATAAQQIDQVGAALVSLTRSRARRPARPRAPQVARDLDVVRSREDGLERTRKEEKAAHEGTVALLAETRKRFAHAGSRSWAGRRGC